MPMSTPVAQAVLVTGVYGAGKSTVVADIGKVLEDHGAPYGLLDVDWLGWFNAAKTGRRTGGWCCQTYGWCARRTWPLVSDDWHWRGRSAIVNSWTSCASPYLSRYGSCGFTSTRPSFNDVWRRIPPKNAGRMTCEWRTTGWQPVAG